MRAAAAHLKAAVALHEAAADHHDKCEGLLAKAVDAIANPEAEDGKTAAAGDGMPEDHIRQAHAHMKAAAGLSALAAEHHEGAEDALTKAVDHFDNPEAEGDDKAARLRRLKALRRTAAAA